MKEKLIKFWQRQLDMIIREESLDARKIFFSQAFGGLTLAMMFCGEDYKKADELADLWNDEWKARLEGKVYEVSFN